MSWQNAQLVHTRDQQPEQWANLQNNIGYYLVLIGERESNPGRFREAVPLLREALRLQTELKSNSAFNTADSLCRALLDDGTARKDRTALLEAKQLCNTAIERMKTAGADPRSTVDTLTRIEAALNSAR